MSLDMRCRSEKLGEYGIYDIYGIYIVQMAYMIYMIYDIFDIYGIYIVQMAGGTVLTKLCRQASSSHKSSLDSFF